MMEEKDEQSFVRLFDDYHQMIYRYIYLRTEQIKEIAEDLTQETFYKAFKKFEKFDRKNATLKTWLFVIARNTVIDYYRTNKTKIMDIENMEEVGVEPKQFELIEFVLNKLNFMKDIERDVVIYKYVYDLPEKEIAKIIGKSYNSTRVLIHRSLNKLKILVNGKDK